MQQNLLRIVVGSLLVLSVIAAGAMVRSAWIILPLGLIYTVMFMQGRWRAWQVAIQNESASSLLSKILSTLVVQTILVALLYFIARGIAAVYNERSSAPFSSWDTYYCLAIGSIGISLGAMIATLERKAISPEISHFETNQSEPIDKDDPNSNGRDEIRLLSESVTPANFFDGIYYGHGTYVGPERTFDSTPNQNSTGSEEKIYAAQTNLGVELPESLKAIYRIQNGGSIDSLCTVKAGVHLARKYDELITPFGGYSDLLPSEKLRTVFDAVTDYADPDDEDQATMFPEGCEKMIILSQWYRHTLFLDYNAPGEPRVGYVDFDHEQQWQIHCVWWKNFADFFNQLRRYEAI